MNQKDRDVQRKLRILKHADENGRVIKTCRYFGIGRASFYRWKALYKQHGEAGLINRKPIPKNPTNRTSAEVVEKVLHLRQTYHLGPIRIVWYLARYHDIKISDAGVYIKPSSPQLNGKVERSHRTDEQEFYQLLTYKDDVDLNEKLAEWESFYNLSRPHGAFNGKAPYEILRERL